MTSTRAALIASILANPQEDTPRLVYADFLEEQGEVERAEFVRAQVELARLPSEPLMTCSGMMFANHMEAQTHSNRCEWCQWTHIRDGKIEPLRRRERELFTHEAIFDWFPLTTDRSGSTCRRKRNEIAFAMFESASLRDSQGRTAPATEQTYHVSRGFISFITCSWADWLRHHERLYWATGQTVECPKCKGSGRAPFANEWQCWICGKEGLRGAASGRIPRPLTDDLAATCQPLQEVMLTSHPLDDESRPLQWPVHRFHPVARGSQGRTGYAVAGKYRFTREKCGVCGGRGFVRAETDNLVAESCPICNDTPPNRWTCDAWPGLVFVMPE